MTLLIKNGLVVDGTGSEPARADVFVSGERISAIGNLSGKRADEVIDAQGMYVTPGFIDAHSEIDHRLEVLRGLEHTCLEEGGTTAIGGHDGMSLAPLLYGDLALFAWQTHIARANVNWHTMKEFKTVLQRKKLAVNFGTLAGYDTVRSALAHDKARKMTKNESHVLRAVLERSVKDGALGVSLGKEEQTMRVARGIVEITEPASEGGASWMAQEVFRHAKEKNARVLVSGATSPFHGDESEKLISFIEKSSAKGEVRVSVCPARSIPVPLIEFIPEEMRAGEPRTVRLKFRDAQFRTKLAKSFPVLDPKETGISHDAQHTSLHGATLKEFMKWHGVADYREGIIKLMEASDFHAALLVPQERARVARAVNSPKSLIGSYGSRSAFGEYIASAFGGDGASLAQAVKKITSEAAEFFGTKERGALKEKYFADLVGVKDGRVQFTAVNGRVALKEGECTGIKTGKFLIPSAEGGSASGGNY